MVSDFQLPGYPNSVDKIDLAPPKTREKGSPRIVQAQFFILYIVYQIDVRLPSQAETKEATSDSSERRERSANIVELPATDVNKTCLLNLMPL